MRGKYSSLESKVMGRKEEAESRRKINNYIQKQMGKMTEAEMEQEVRKRTSSKRTNH